jgi:hypothetical protein
VRSRLASYRKTESDLTGLSAEGGRLEAWFDGDRPAFLSATVYGETGRAEHELCYGEDGSLFAVKTTASRYDQPFGKVAGVQEDRLFFQGGKLIRWTVDGGPPVSRDSSEYAGKEKETLELAKALAEAAGAAARPTGQPSPG